ncbi:MAG TPA: hypothetical protein DEP66_02440 [Acidimicrobiaceae bacterium]|nr:hypothetical protein [Acidimicrobiaceae bacterium]
MSSLWTPSGEHLVSPVDQAGEPGGDSPDGVLGGGEPVTARPTAADIDPETAQAMEEQLRQAQEQLISMPAAQVVMNHLIGLFELAALHLRRDPPALDEARLPIDAVSVLLDGLGDRLPESEAVATALQQMQMSFVQASSQDGAGPASAGPDGAGPAGAAEPE